MVRAILIDDEPNATDMLSWQLENFCPQVEVIAICNNSIDAIEIIKGKKPDVVFLDIEMPHLNGFDLLSKFDSVDFEVVFTTAYDQFAIKAFKFSALDYLLKPIDKTELINVIARIEKTAGTKTSGEQINIAQQVLKEKRGSDKLALATTDGLLFINVNQVIRCESDNNYTYIFLDSGKKHCATRSLKDVEEILAEHPFFRVHQSHLVNLNHIEKFIRDDGGYIVTSDGTNITVARARKEKFLELFSRL